MLEAGSDESRRTEGQATSMVVGSAPTVHVSERNLFTWPRLGSQIGEDQIDQNGRAPSE